MGRTARRTRESWLEVLSGWPRRALALVLLLAALLSALSHRADRSAEAVVSVAVAARALPPGHHVTAADLLVDRWPQRLVPAGAANSPDQLVGHTVAGPVARGEPLTRARLLDTSITDSLRPGQVAVTISLPDQGQQAVLAPGSLIDVYAAPASQEQSPDLPATKRAGQLPAPLAQSLRVLAVPTARENTTTDGLTVIVAADPVVAGRLANQASGTFVATLKPP